MKKLLFPILIIIFNTLNSNCQDKFDFPIDPITKKFSIIEIVEMPGKSKNDFFQAIKGVATQFVFSAHDNKEKDELVKQVYITTFPSENIDSTRLFYKVLVTQISSKTFKTFGYTSYMTLHFNMNIYVKDGKYKIELTEFDPSGADSKLNGSTESIEAKNSSNKNWNKMKKEIYDDGNYVKNSFKKNICKFWSC